MPRGAAHVPLHTSPFGYVPGNTLDKVHVPTVEQWMASKYASGKPPYLFCYASRCFFLNEAFSAEQRNKNHTEVRYSLHKPKGMRMERWKELAQENKNLELNFMAAEDVRNRAFAVFLGKNTQVTLLDADGVPITSVRLPKERKRKE